jgi:hypothetical protein
MRLRYRQNAVVSLVRPPHHRLPGPGLLILSGVFYFNDLLSKVPRRVTGRTGSHVGLSGGDRATGNPEETAIN